MNNKLLTLMLSGLLIINNSFATNRVEEHVASQPTLIGGCGAPQFFTHYDKKAINEIVKNKNLKRIDISYPHGLSNLAKKISNTIKKHAKAQVVVAEFNVEDNDSVSYRHDAVVVTGCSK